MDQLLKKGAGLGLNPSQIEEALTLGRPAKDGAWIESQDLLEMAQKVADETMEGGRYIEYCCYDSSWAPQGRAVVQLIRWEADGDFMFVGDHGPSSDGYYDWYVKQIGASGFVFHICAGEASKCKAKKARGDARELIHIDKWRMLTPKLMLQHEYMVPEGLRLGEEELIKMARDLKGPAPLGTGLDVARKKLAEKVEKEDGGPAEALGAEPELGLMLGSGSELRSKKRGREPMGDFLAKQASKQQAAGVGERKGKKKKKKKIKDRKEGEVSLTPSSSSEESSSFHAAPVRGGKELWRVAQKKPGRLTRLALDEMTRYLADKMEENEVEVRWRGQKVQAYLNQILFLAHQPTKVGLRTSRELTTLGPSGGSVASGDRHVDAEAEGVGSLPPRGGLASGQALGDNSSLRSLPDERGGARTGHKERASIPEVEGCRLEDAEGQQIGVGQRVRPRRETREPSQSERGEERSSKKGKPSSWALVALPPLTLTPLSRTPPQWSQFRERTTKPCQRRRP